MSADGEEPRHLASRDERTDEFFRSTETRPRESAVPNMIGASWPRLGKSDFGLETKDVATSEVHAHNACRADDAGDVAPEARGEETRVESAPVEVRDACGDGQSGPEYEEQFRGNSRALRLWESRGSERQGEHERGEGKNGNMKRMLAGLGDLPRDAAALGRSDARGSDPSNLFASTRSFPPDLPAVFREDLRPCEEEVVGPVGSHGGCLSLSQETAALCNGNRGTPVSPARTLDYFSISSSWGTAPSVSGTPTSYNLCAKGISTSLPPGQGALAHLGCTGSPPAVSPSGSHVSSDNNRGAQPELLHPINEDSFPGSFQQLPENASAVAFADSAAELKESACPATALRGAPGAPVAQRVSGLWGIGHGSGFAGAAPLAPPTPFQSLFLGTAQHGNGGAGIHPVGEAAHFVSRAFPDENFPFASPISPSFPVARHPAPDTAGASSPRRSPSLVSSSTTCPSHSTLSAASPHTRPAGSVSPAFPYAGANLHGSPGVQNLTNLVSPLQLQHLLQLGALSNGFVPNGSFDRRAPADGRLHGNGRQPDLSQLGCSPVGIDIGTSNASGFGDRDNSSGSEASMKLACGPLSHVLRSNPGACGVRHAGSVSLFPGVGSPVNYGCPPVGSEGLPHQAGRTFVGNIPPDITRASVKRLAERYGTVLGVEYDPHPGRWAYAYIIFATATMADRAASAMHGKRAFEHAEFHRLVSCRCAKDFPLTRLPLTKMDLPCLNVPPSSDGSVNGGGRGIQTPPRFGQLSSPSLSLSALKTGWSHADLSVAGSGSAPSTSSSSGGQDDSQPNAATGILAALGTLGSSSAIQGLRTVPGKACVLDPAVIQEQARKTTFTLLRDGPPGANLFIYGIPACWKELELMVLVGQFGHVVGIRVPPASSAVVPPSSNFPAGGPIGSSNTNSTLLSCCSYNRGFGFASYDNTSAAFDAFRQLSGLVVAGKALKIQLKNGEEHLLDSALKAIANNGSPVASPSPNWNPVLGGGLGATPWDGQGPGGAFFAQLPTGGGLPSGRSWGGGSASVAAMVQGQNMIISPGPVARGPGPHAETGGHQLFPYSVPSSPVQRFGSLPPAGTSSVSQQMGGSFLGVGGALGVHTGLGAAGRLTGSAGSPAFTSTASVCSSTSGGHASGSRGPGPVTFAPSDPFLAVTAAGLCSLLAASGGGGRGGMTAQQQLLLQQAFSTMTPGQKQQLLLLLTQSASQDCSSPDATKGERDGHPTADGSEGSQVANSHVPSVASSSVESEAGAGGAAGSLGSGTGNSSFTLRDFLVGGLSQHQPKVPAAQPEAEVGSGAKGHVVSLQHTQQTAPGVSAPALPNAAGGPLPPLGQGTEPGEEEDAGMATDERTRLPVHGYTAISSTPGEDADVGEWEAFCGGPDRLFGTLLSQNSHAFSPRGKNDSTTLRFVGRTTGEGSEAAAAFFKSEDPGSRTESREFSFLLSTSGQCREGSAKFTPGEGGPSPAVDAVSPRRLNVRRQTAKGDATANTDDARKPGPDTRGVSSHLGSATVVSSDFCLVSRGAEDGKYRISQTGSRALSCPPSEEPNACSPRSELGPAPQAAGKAGGAKDVGPQARECVTSRTLVHQLAQCVSMLTSPAGFFRTQDASGVWPEKAETEAGEASPASAGEKREEEFAGWNDNGRESGAGEQKAGEGTARDTPPRLPIPEAADPGKKLEARDLHTDCLGRQQGATEAKQWENEAGRNAASGAAQNGRQGVRDGSVLRDQGDCHGDAVAVGRNAQDTHKGTVHSSGVDPFPRSREASLDASSPLFFFLEASPGSAANPERVDCLSPPKAISSPSSRTSSGGTVGSASLPRFGLLGSAEAGEASATRAELVKDHAVRGERHETGEARRSPSCAASLRVGIASAESALNEIEGYSSRQGPSSLGRQPGEEAAGGSSGEASLKDFGDGVRRDEVPRTLAEGAANGASPTIPAIFPSTRDRAMGNGERSWPLGFSGSSAHELPDDEGRISGRLDARLRPSSLSSSPFPSLEDDVIPVHERESNPTGKAVNDASNGGSKGPIAPPPPTFKASQRRVKRTDLSLLTSGGAGFLHVAGRAVQSERREGFVFPSEQVSAYATQRDKSDRSFLNMPQSQHSVLANLASSHQGAAMQNICGRVAGVAPNSLRPCPSTLTAGPSSGGASALRSPLPRQRPSAH
uniref:RNA recognition motif-containing protein,putative n=1 Tax=Neospora caninum (strain Liverpool) TaxID=572307 RepID=A0A0F7UDR1_NEOCL|nr:TPA: RNA recognition motif-containing protein,putative [Neospora caninum Liverpool]